VGQLVTELGYVTAQASAQQEQMWVSESLLDHSTAYLMAEAFRVEQDIDPVRLSECLTRLQDRHEALANEKRRV
jgi:hypothetical protein